MRVLISAKVTNLDVHGHHMRRKVELGLLSQAYLDRLQEDHNFHHQTRSALLQYLDQKGIAHTWVQRGSYWPDLASVDAVITVGGDGTILEASHHLTNLTIPLIGVRSSPMSVGFLCATDISNLEETIAKLAAGTLAFREIARLCAKVSFATAGELTTDPILNDFLYANASPAATTRYKIMFGQLTEMQKSSGIWIATAAGSTAAIHAAGGPIMKVDQKESQYLVRELYRPRGAQFHIDRGLFDPDQTPLVVENLSEKALLALDGQWGEIALSVGDRFELRRASPLRMLVRS